MNYCALSFKFQCVAHISMLFVIYRIQFLSSCWKSDKDNSCRKLTEAVCQSLRDMKQVLVDDSSSPSKFN